jgi:hypothetical protein
MILSYTIQLQQMLQQRHAARDAERAALAAEDDKRKKAALYLGKSLLNEFQMSHTLTQTLRPLQLMQ